MRILEINPISRSVFSFEPLSYFSIKPLSAGDLVKISLRGKIIPGIVKHAAELAPHKAELKKRSFRLKPVAGVIKEKFFSQEVLSVLTRLSEFTLVPEGLIASKFFPKAVLSRNALSFPGENRTTSLAQRPNGYGVHKKISLTGTRGERVREYRGLIREHFARSKSVMLITPRLPDLKSLESELARGIEEYVFSFSSEIPSSQYLMRWNRALSNPHPVLILGTGQILLFPRDDLESVILDEEGSSDWRERERPWLDFRLLAEIIAKEKGQKLLLGGEILKVETIWKSFQGLVENKTSPASRLQGGRAYRLIPVSSRMGEGFSWITQALVEELEESIGKGERILVFVNRKGYSSFTLCQDCSRPVLCPSCTVPLVIHPGQSENRTFVCHHCLTTLPVAKRCPSCLSWRLKDFGLGIEKVEEELKKRFPKIEFSQLENRLLEKRKRNTPGDTSFLLATEKILSYPDVSFDLVAVVSLDHLFTIPDFRIHERIFRLVTELKQRARKKIILQTRFPEERLLPQALEGDLSHFYQEEILRREAFRYPPFSRIIKLSKEDRDWPRLKKRAEEAERLLENWNPLSSPAFIEKIKNKYRWNLILKILPESWPHDPLLSEALKALRQDWEILVEPETLL